jgi:hypothetical protein
MWRLWVVEQTGGSHRWCEVGQGIPGTSHGQGHDAQRPDHVRGIVSRNVNNGARRWGQITLPRWGQSTMPFLVSSFAQPDATSTWEQHGGAVEQLQKRFPQAVLQDAAPRLARLHRLPQGALEADLIQQSQCFPKAKSCELGSCFRRQREWPIGRSPNSSGAPCPRCCSGASASPPPASPAWRRMPPARVGPGCMTSRR